MSKFEFTPTETGGYVALLRTRMFSKRPIPTDAWSSQAGPDLIAAVRYLKRLEDSGEASASATGIDLTTPTLLEMPGTILAQIGVPAVAPLSLKLSLRNRVEAPDGEIQMTWADSNYRSLEPVRQGLIVKWHGTRVGRLTAPVHALVEAVERYNASKGQPSENRIAAWAPVQQRLQSLAGTKVQADRVLSTFRIFQAGAFSLDVKQALDGPQFNPVLMSASLRATLEDEADAPEDGAEPTEALKDEAEHALLSPELQNQFLRAFNQDGLATRPSYVLGRNTYLVVEPELQQALDIIKRAQRAPAPERRAFVQNPRAALVQALPGGDETAGTLFIETRQYSERVTELGIWEKPKLDWIRRKSTGWLPEGFVLQVGSQTVPLDEPGLQHLASAFEEATARGDDFLQYQGLILVTSEVSAAFEELKKGNIPEPGPGEPEPETEKEPEPDRAVLKKKENLEEVEFTIDLRPRPLFAQKLFPSDLVDTQPKPHQIDGFGWLVDAWTSGLPGVLLADDMGLGKTMQALAFLAWFRENRRVGRERARQFAGPILVVAPTALLRNWVKEAETHLAGAGLGDCLAAFGSGLARLRRREAAPEDALDVDAIRSADWVLTTYETLANYHRAFARVAYPIIVFDEMQKIKAPDTINTHAAKVMNADFVLGMTGTPIENRIEDLWCLMDRVAPGYLGALKPFSSTYGGEDPEALRTLKAKVDQPQPGHPPLTLRRMKDAHLRGLPSREVKTYADPHMPAVQAEAYAQVVRSAKSGARSKGDMLKVIHALRGISLHPHGADGVDPYDPRSRQAWIEKSVRVQQVLAILEQIRQRREKALVFIEDRAVQTVFAAVVAAHFELLAEPDIINGETPGDRRQQIVDRFQSLPPDFALLVLSPKAAGVGLTITAANHVIHLSRWWNPAVEDQCNDRVYRIGQEKPVTIHVPLAVHPAFGESSFDLKLDSLLAHKRALSRDMLMPPVSDSDAESLFAEAVDAASVGA